MALAGDAVEDLKKAAWYIDREIQRLENVAARAVLPNMTNSPMVVSGNHRAWRYVIKNRWHEAADAEIRGLAGELLGQLKRIAPGTYSDMPDRPYSY